MPGQIPKPAAIRQRQNRASTRATLTSTKGIRVPSLPKVEGREWQALTVAWWRDTWKSPMAAEFHPSDIHALYVLADLIDRYWTKPSTELAGEIRQHRQAFGLTPLDRRRLEWSIERAETAARKRPAPPAPAPVDDPRKLLSVV